jgi:hypothetical protein
VRTKPTGYGRRGITRISTPDIHGLKPKCPRSGLFCFLHQRVQTDHIVEVQVAEEAWRNMVTQYYGSTPYVQFHYMPFSHCRAPSEEEKRAIALIMNDAQNLNITTRNINHKKSQVFRSFLAQYTPEPCCPLRIKSLKQVVSFYSVFVSSRA